MYNSLDTNSQEARAEVPFGATPRSESKKRKVADHSPLLDVNDDDAAEDLPTSPTSCHNVPRFERHAQDGNSPVKKEADDEMQMDAAPCEEDASGDAEQAGEEASESVQDLVDRLLSRKDELPKLDVRSLLAVQQELSKALVEVVARTLG